MSEITRRRLGLGLVAFALAVGVSHFGGLSLPEGLGVRTAGGLLKVVVLIDRYKTLPAAQQSALDSAAADEYLSTHAAKDSTGSPAVRSWESSLTADQITDDADLKAIYTQAKTDSSGAAPWVRIVAGSRSKSCAFPATEADWLALLKSLGGS